MKNQELHSMHDCEIFLWYYFFLMFQICESESDKISYYTISNASATTLYNRVGRKCTFAQTFEIDEAWGRKSCVLGCSVTM